MITNYESICVICGRPAEAIHHLIEGNGRRELSDKYKLTAPLCANCHNISKDSVHLNPKMKAMSNIIGQLEFERRWLIEKYQLPFEDLSDDAREEFRKIFGKSYL